MRGNPSPNPNHFCQALYVDTDRDNKLSYNYLLLGGHSVIMAWFPQESGLRSGVFFRTYPSTSKMFSLKKWTNKQKINVGRIFLFLEQFSPSGSFILVSATIDWLQRYKKHNQKLLKLHLKSYQKTQDFSLSFTMSWMFNDNRVITINTVFWNSWKVIVCDVPVLQPLAITAKFESNIRSYSMGWAMKKMNIFSRYDYFFLFSIRRQ